MSIDPFIPKPETR